MKLTLFLTFLIQLKIYHWQTFSYSQHKALGKSYENLDNLFDKFIEVYYGKYGKGDYSIVYNVNALSYKETDIKKELGNRKRELLSYLRNDLLQGSDSDLLNIVDEIESEVNHLQYLLDLS
jgi:hypothetical protein